MKLPQRLGPYVLIHRLGEGGLSDVFLAIRDGKPFAVKCLKPVHAESPRYVADFVREIRIASRLNHPTTAKILDHGKVNKTYFAVMDLAVGGSLQELIDICASKSESVPLPIVLYTIRKLTHALRYLHSQQIFEYSHSYLFHGDLSPDNIVLVQDGTIRLLDFGSSSQETQMQSEHRHMGKIFYLPPEILKGVPVSTETDVYSLGVIAFYLTAGRRPFEATNKVELCREIQNAPVPEVDFSDIVMSKNDATMLRIFFNKALHKNPKLRFDTIASFERDFFAVHFSVPELESPAEVQPIFEKFLGYRVRRLEEIWSTRVAEFETIPVEDIQVVESRFPVESLFSRMERRKHPRVLVDQKKVSVDVLSLKDRIKLNFNVRELSQGGMMVRWQSLIPDIGSEYPIVLYLEKGGAPIRLSGRLLYEAKQDGRTYVGFQFSELKEGDREAIRTFVSKRLDESAEGAPAVDRQDETGNSGMFLDVYFRSMDEFRTELEKNIRHGGLFVRSDQAYQTDQQVLIRIQLPNRLRKIVLSGKVVYCQPTEKATGSQKDHGVGLELKLTEDQLRDLEV